MTEAWPDFRSKQLNRATLHPTDLVEADAGDRTTPKGGTLMQPEACLVEVMK
jgi:hypothetical protein